eukprot:jgi/Tetstr1/433959/TSEL_023136.t1
MRACCCCVILAAIIVSAVGAVAGAVFIGSQPASRASLGAQKVVGPGVGLSGQPRSDRLLVANFLAEPTAAPDVVELLEHAESGGGGDVQGWSATGGTDMALTLAHESTELSMYSIPLGGDLPEDDGGVQDGDPRLDPMAHSFPWARPLIPLNLRSVIPEAAQRVSPDRKLQMLPFKVWVKHSVIGAELDNGPSRVWLTDHPLSSNDFVLDPERVAKSQLCWHRFLRGAFLRQMLANVAVIASNVLAMYITILSVAYGVNAEVTTPEPVSPAPRRDFGDVEVPNAADVREWLDTLITISAILYPVVTTWCIASISWEQAMRKEIFYVLLHYKIIVDLENESWTPGRRFARSPLTSFFFYWIIIGSGTMILTVLANMAGSSAITTVAVIVLTTIPLFSWWFNTVTPEWTTIPLAKFFEMKRDAGEGMDLETALEFLKGCATVPEAALQAISANMPTRNITTALHNCCPLPYFVYGSCTSRKAPTQRQRERVPNLIQELRDQGAAWWRERAAFDATIRWPPAPAVKSDCCGHGEGWARNKWGSILMRMVLPFTDDLSEIHHLVRQYNCWCGSAYIILNWAIYAVEIWLALSFARGDQQVIDHFSVP